MTLSIEEITAMLRAYDREGELDDRLETQLLELLPMRKCVTVQSDMVNKLLGWERPRAEVTHRLASQREAWKKLRRQEQLRGS